MVLTIVVFLLTLLVLVLSHELGHFLAAKKFNIKVLEFGFGIPPKIWGKKIGETIFSLNALPIGGFVRLLGEDELDKQVLDDKRSFAKKPVWQRSAVVGAGVIMNFFLAFFIFSGVLLAQGYQEEIPLLTDHYNFWGVQQENKPMIIIGRIEENSPAQKASIQIGDQVTAFNSQPLTDGKQLVELTKKYSGQVIKLTLLDQNNSLREVSLTPRSSPPKGQGALGVELSTLTVANLTYPAFTQKLAAGFIHSYNVIAYSFNILGQIFQAAWQTKTIEPVSDTLSGPVGITNITKTILQTHSPLLPYLNFLGMLSLNLAFINILPFPALDGGRLFFLLIEGVLRKKVKAEIEKWVHTIGMAFLLALIILITYSDIRKIFLQ